MSGFVGTVHRCQRPELRLDDVGKVWQCTCGRRWVVRRSDPEFFIDTRPIKDVWFFESTRKYEQRVREWEERIATYCAPEWMPLAGDAPVDPLAVSLPVEEQQ